ncbi:MAG: 2,3-bisphosphoglycerate-independent phosphoglycerate mutase [SAR202 cluster bacterium]|nr:2,3-bisphosphoglycerate-independent phosphoglycerate mutase [SAR202 cluster bacterium]
MIESPYLKNIRKKTDSKIVMLVVDGLGGLPDPKTGKTELETASLPNLDRMAQLSEAGVTTPVAPGITPGSGPGHLALFGYDPLEFLVGRGACETLGIDVQMGPDAIAARANFCTLDSDGNITSRRADRIGSEESIPLVNKLDTVQLSSDVAVEVHHVESYRFVLVLRGEGLGSSVKDTDPQDEGVSPLLAKPEDPTDVAATRTAELVNTFAEKAAAMLGSRDRANFFLLRGFSREPVDWPDFGKSYCLDPGAIAAYPMYRGLAKITGMKILEAGDSFDTELQALESNYANHDYFFLHYKPADAAGEDADFEKKVRRLEELDAQIPRILDLAPDVLVVAGDHSTPSTMGAHSWHPVPLLIYSQFSRGLGVDRFTERSCSLGSLGHRQATDVMILALAHAEKLKKFGA